MMNKKVLRKISGGLILTLAVSLFGNMDLSAYAQETTEIQPYIIAVEDAKTYDTVEEALSDNLVVETPVLSENHIMVAELTEPEAAALERDDAVWIEEDIILSASSLEMSGEDKTSEEMTIEEAHRRKAQIVKRNQEELEAWERGERDIEDVEEVTAGYEWNLQAIHADGVAVEEEQVAEKVRVAVLDSGVDYVSGINLAGYVNFVDEDQETSPMFQDETGHGTGIASIIAGNGENGVYGVNPNVELYSVKVLDGENRAPLSRIIRAIYWCMENDIHIINMSFGTSVYSKLFKQAVANANRAGLLLIGAAGNGKGAVEYPAAFPEVMAVTATNPEAQISEFSNRGDELDVAAPGEKIRVIGFFNGSIVTHGTSIAAPHVTGVASLLWEKDLTKSSSLIRQLICQSARKLEDTDVCGLLDAGYAMELYDQMADTYLSESTQKEELWPENAEEPEIFEEVALDDAYVEGRWTRSGHVTSFEKTPEMFSVDEISNVRRGVTYPDQKASGWEGCNSNPRWHGKWKGSTTKDNVNYVAILEMVTTIAIEGGAIRSYMDRDYFRGIDVDSYKQIKADIRNLEGQYAGLLTHDTLVNRKCFLYGCAMHAIQDAFAHSTTTPTGHLITHISRGICTYADDETYYKNRMEVAKALTEYMLAQLNRNDFSSGKEVAKALNSTYDTTFKMVKIKQFLNDNGYSSSTLKDINIDTPIE